ncbi:MAG: V-type ATP synthase subunit F [Oscillospiraceae bacterium]|jgi:V/A-type H+-transporting ATPase subunit F|nr:V-type ATP synthase subunit F [Oscillospiraceae bacterium]
MDKIAVLGDRGSVLGFRAIGLDTHFAESPEEAAPILKKLAAEEAAIIYITEQLAEGLTEEIAAYKDSVLPAIIPIPGRQGSLGIGMAALKSAVERAVGADIL